MSEHCVFCEIACGIRRASVVWQDELTIAFMDLRQFHPGHTLVIPRQHFRDIRELEEPVGAALMASVKRVAIAVAAAFPNQGLSLWHSIGEAADQEVPHLHMHVHPRLLGDQLLRIYPRSAPEPSQALLDGYAAALRAVFPLTPAQRVGFRTNSW